MRNSNAQRHAQPSRRPTPPMATKRAAICLSAAVCLVLVGGIAGFDETESANPRPAGKVYNARFGRSFGTPFSACVRFAREPGTANVQSLGDMSWDYRANGKWQIMERSPGNGGIGLNIHFWGKANDNRIKGHAIGGTQGTKFKFRGRQSNNCRPAPVNRGNPRKAPQ